MNRQLHARKRRQFKSLSKQLNNLLQKERTRTSKGKIEAIVLKIKYLLRELSGIIARWEMKKILGTAAIMFGLATASVQGQSFSAPVVNPFGLSPADGLSIPVLADFDNDGDIDLLTSEYYGYYNPEVRFRYYENVGTASEPSFDAGQTSPFGLQAQTENAIIPTAADLDGDGDLDILVGSYKYDSSGYGAFFDYYENIGTAESPSFAPPQSDPFGIVPGSNYFPTPALADLDGDGDVDLISSTYDYSYANGNYYYHSFSYYENIGDAENPQFAEPTLSPFGLAFGPNVNSYISFPSIADLDSDGDLDLLCSINGEYYNNGIEYEGGIFYFENTGDTTNPQFEVSERNPVGISIPNAVYYQVLLPTLADLDGDGDNDFLGCAPEGDFYYYENTLMVSTTIPQADFSVNIFPNPINNYLNIDTNEPLTQIEIYDLFGRQLATYNGQQTQISIKDLSSGTYTIRLINEEGQFLSKRIEKL